MRAVIYARYSTERQTEASIADQFRVCRNYAALRGWSIVAEHADQGISGAALGNRPGVQAATRSLGHGDVLLVIDLSRLSRSQDLAPLITRIRYKGGRILGVQDGFDSSSRTARMQAGLSGIMSEEQLEMARARSHSALEMRALDGKPTGGKAFADVELVREIFTRFAAGETMKAIASDLNRRGIPSPGAMWKPRAGTRGRWLVSALHALLQNEIYIGRKVWNRSRWVKDPDSGIRTRQERPESEWIVRQVEPVIDRETWDRAQARFKQRAGRGGVARYLLSGLLECAVCGSKLIVYGGGKQQRYICSQFHGGGVYACSNSKTFPRLNAEAEILKPVEEDLLSPNAYRFAMEDMREARIEAGKAGPSSADIEVEQLERLVREGLVSADTLAPALAEARRKAQETRSTSVVTDIPWPSEKLWRETVAGMREVLRGDDIPAARELLREHYGPAICEPVEGGVMVELAGRRRMVATGTGRWVGSGGALRIYLPSSTRGHQRSK